MRWSWACCFLVSNDKVKQALGSGQTLPLA